MNAKQVLSEVCNRMIAEGSPVIVEMAAPVAHPNQHEKNEWSRMAKAMYANGHNAIGHRYSAAAALRNGDSIQQKRFDQLQHDYRQWLVFNTVPA